MNELIVEVDSRQRVSLNNYLAHPDLVAAVEHSRQHPEQRRERPARATR